MVHGTMSRLMFGLIKATWLPGKMKEKVRQPRKGLKREHKDVTATIKPRDWICGNHNCAQCTRCHTCTERNQPAWFSAHMGTKKNGAGSRPSQCDSREGSLMH